MSVTISFVSTTVLEPEILNPSALERLVIVSNREPYTIKVNNKEISFEKTPGGLVSALDPILRQRNGLWICWEGAKKKVAEFDDVSFLRDDIDWEAVELPYTIQSVALTENEINHYYYGYANSMLWSLFHYFINSCNFFDEQDWISYHSANQKFANAVIEHTDNTDWVWIQDYHLMLVPKMVRTKAPKRKLAFFLHTPFPSVEVFRVLPKRAVILKGLLGSDLIGFHVPEYVNHFLDAVEQLLPCKDVRVNRENNTITYQGRTIQVAAFPISIDFKQVEDLALTPPIQEEALRLKDTYNVEWLGISVDRLDYSKGILENLEAIRVFFQKYPDHKKRFSFIQIAAPTRTEVPEYQRLKEEIEQAVGRINGELAQDNWVPIHYFYRSFPMDAVLPYFMVADVAMITPLRDGMNLVVKEYCTAKTDLRDVLLLSEFTGASAELTEALHINPFDVEQVADTLYEALHLPKKIREAKMRALRNTISLHDIHDWIRKFMEHFDYGIAHR
jgi:trehalose 6-phosphate synthase/phosphatase